MKILKYLLLCAGLLLLVAAVIAHLERERLASEIANFMLAGSGFELTDIGIARVGTGTIRLSRIAVAGEDGSRYRANDVLLGLDLADRQVTKCSIGELSIQPGSEGHQPAVTELIDRALNLPELFPDLEVTVEKLSHPSLHEIENLHWRASKAAQRATMLVYGIRLSAGIESIASSKHRVNLAAGADSSPMLEVGLELERFPDSYSAAGDVRLVADVLVDALRERELVSSAGVSIAGTLDGKLSASVDAEATGMIRLTIAGGESGGLNFTWQPSAGTGPAFDTSDLQVKEFQLNLPGLEWRVTFGKFTGAVSSDEFADADLTVEALECMSGSRCTATVDLLARQLAVGNYRAARARIHGAATVTMGSETRATLVPVSLSAEEIAGDGWLAAKAELKSARDALVLIDADDTVVAADSLALRISRMALADGLTASADVTLGSLEYSFRDVTTSARFSLPKANTSITYKDSRITPFKIEGNFELANDSGSASLQASDPDRGLVAEIDVDLLSDTTALHLTNLSVDFSTAPLSASLDNWPYDWDIVSGKASSSGQLVIAGPQGPTGNAGSFDVRFDNVAGNAGDIGATGASGTTTIELRPGLAPRIGPGELQVDLLEVGLPIRDIRASFDWDTSSDFALVDDLRMELLGGTARADQFRIDVSNLDTSIALEIDGVQLSLIAQLAEFDDIEVSGALSGMIPVTMTNGQLTVDNGNLESVAPGGAIRYQSQSIDKTSSLGFAQRALSNLQYERLSSDVTYTPEGDLKLKMRLEGINPDVDPLQPVILNLSVENNIPKLLRSLQATRDIESIIESRTRQ